MVECRICSRVYEYDRKKGHTRTKCNSCSVNEGRFAKKIKAVAYKGGQCQSCGYSRSHRALVFHHVDPREKDFGISGSYSRSWKSIKSELDKCILLCRNCHAEAHDEIDRTGKSDFSGIKSAEHGEYRKYRQGCRCEKCRRANTNRMRAYRLGL